MKKTLIIFVLTSLLFSGQALASEFSGILSNNPEYTQIAAVQFPSSTSTPLDKNNFDISLMVKIGIVSILVVEILALVFIGQWKKRRHIRSWSTIKKEVS